MNSQIVITGEANKVIDGEGDVVLFQVSQHFLLPFGDAPNDVFGSVDDACDAGFG